jgi:predicted dehydrogenase
MTVRVALVGCGTVARRLHLPGLREGGDAEVVAFASRSLASAEQARDEWGSGDAGTDWRSAVARDDVDAVHVCVPNALHAEVAAAALQAGKHVLVEKPITTTLADADAVLALAGDRVLGVAFDGRCHAQLQELQRRLPAIGAVRRAEAVFGHGGPQLWAPEAGWFRDLALSGGGCLLDLGVHVLDVLRWCVGPVTDVLSAQLSGPVDEQADLEVLAGGVPARVRVSWQAPEPEFSFAFTGETGTLVLAGGELRHDGALVEVPPVELRTAAGAFARAVATGTAPPATGVDGRAALAAALAGYESARTGAPVVVA